MTDDFASLTLNYSNAQGLSVGWVANPIKQHSVALEALPGYALKSFFALGIQFAPVQIRCEINHTQRVEPRCAALQVGLRVRGAAGFSIFHVKAKNAQLKHTH